MVYQILNKLYENYELKCTKFINKGVQKSWINCTKIVYKLYKNHGLIYTKIMYNDVPWIKEYQNYGIFVSKCI